MSLKKCHLGRDLKRCEGCVKGIWEKTFPEGGSSHAQRV